jgi:polyhydroxyalkanoate synthesis repressor PhaR
MSEPRVIKKYPNRRLYDTAESRYITLADIRKLVVENVEFVVIDKKSQEDITRSILLQEHVGDPLMSSDFLSQVIRSYGGVMQGLIGSYLEQSLKLFAAQQREIRERVRNQGGDSLSGASALASENFGRWQSVQDEIFRLMSASRLRADSIEETKHS